MKCFFTFLFVSIGTTLFAQLELVPNGDFESDAGDQICDDPSCLITAACNPDFCCRIPCKRGVLHEDAKPWEQVGTGANQNNAELFDDRWKFCPDNSSCNEMGMGLTAENTNYLGITQTIRSTGHRYAHLQAGPLGRNDGIGIKLRHSLVPSRLYTLRFYVANKSSGNIAGNIPDVDIKIRVGSDNGWGNGVEQQEVSVSGVPGDPDPWELVTVNFTVSECGMDFLMIRHESQVAGDRHALIDDISLFDPQFDQCLLDYDGAILGNVHTSGLHTADEPFTIFGLETVSYFNLKIEDVLNQTIIRDIVLTNPFNTYSWDGKKDDGTVANDAQYKYDLIVKNDGGCKTLTDAFSKNGNYITNPENPPHSTNPDPIKNVSKISDLPLTFSGLEFVTEFDLKIGNVRHLVISNPADIVAWDGKDDFGNDVSNMLHPYTLTVKNNCNSKTLGGVYPIAFPNVYPPTSVYYDYHSFPKPNTSFLMPIRYPCECLNNCEDYNRPPLPCCTVEPDMQLSNTLISLTKIYEATNSITVGPGVNILSSSDITFHAPNVIILDPGCITALGAKITLDLTPCVHRLQSNGSYSSSQNTEGSTDSMMPLYVSSEPAILNISPNPSDGQFSIFTSAFKMAETSVYNSIGQQIYSAVTHFPLSIDFSSQPEGIYFIRIQVGEKVYTEKVVIQ